jgi:hypothetical protein
LSIGLIFLLIGVVVVAIGVPILVVVAGTGSAALVGLVVLLFVLALVTVGVLGSTLNGIYSAAVYRYAVEGDTGGFFSGELVQGAFRRK